MQLTFACIGNKAIFHFCAVLSFWIICFFFRFTFLVACLFVWLLFCLFACLLLCLFSSTFSFFSGLIFVLFFLFFFVFFFLFFFFFFLFFFRASSCRRWARDSARPSVVAPARRGCQLRTCHFPECVQRGETPRAGCQVSQGSRDSRWRLPSCALCDGETGCAPRPARVFCNADEGDVTQQPAGHCTPREFGRAS